MTPARIDPRAIRQPFPPALAQSRVRIWSGEDQAYRRLGADPLTLNPEEATVYPFDTAWRLTRHADPVKQLEIEVVQ